MSTEAGSLKDLRIDRSARATVRPRRAIWIGLLLTVLAGGAAAAAWWWLGRASAMEVTASTVREAVAGERGAVLNASGYVTARRRATVSSKVTGKVVSVLVEEGMEVKQGQVLARLDDVIARAQLSLAEAQLTAAQGALAEIDVRIKEARLTLDRNVQLVKEGITGQAVLDAAQAELDSLIARAGVSREQVTIAEREVALQRAALDDLVIRAPFTGVAISKDAQPGEMVSPNSAGGGFTRTGISTIVDMSSLEVEVEVNESYINRVTPNQRVEAVLDAYQDWRIPGKVITTIPAADRQKATVLVRIAFDALDPRILPDMGVKVSFLSDEPADAAAAARPQLRVAKSAVRTDNGSSIVFVIKQDTVERRAVRVGAADGDQVEILSGLNPGEQIVTTGPATLADGNKVVVR